MIPVFLLALALSADATAVAAAMGAAGRARARVWFAATLFGLAQAGMSALGALGGEALSARIGGADRWVAFAVLVGIGGRATWKAWRGDEEEDGADEGPWAIPLLAIATSLDALAAGVSLPRMGLPIGVSATIIGAVTFVASALGGALGFRLGERFGQRVQILGGLVLCAIGVEVLLTR